MRFQIRLAKPLIVAMDIEANRKSQDRLGALGAAALRGRVGFGSAGIDGVTACWVTPPEPRRDCAILYLHGGGYVAGGLLYACGFGSVLADLTQRSVLCVAYRLAPEYPFPAALDDALTAYRHMLKCYDPRAIALVGESAGGGLCYALSLRLKAENLPLPSCIAALSPWTDLAMTGASYDKCRNDPSLSCESLSMNVNLYAGENTKDPFVSPLYGELSNMPPSLIFAGSEELLLDDAAHMAQRLNDANSKCELHIEPGMWHVYPLFGIHESKAALKRLNEFVKENSQ